MNHKRATLAVASIIFIALSANGSADIKAKTFEKQLPDGTIIQLQKDTDSSKKIDTYTLTAKTRNGPETVVLSAQTSPFEKDFVIEPDFGEDDVFVYDAVLYSGWISALYSSWGSIKVDSFKINSLGASRPLETRLADRHIEPDWKEEISFQINKDRLTVVRTFIDFDDDDKLHLDKWIFLNGIFVKGQSIRMKKGL
jgi:hypothetical protein